MLPFDLVAYKTCTFTRVQVKYRSIRSGTVKVNFRATWSDGNGYHSRAIDKTQIDVVCIYCPDTDECYYVSPKSHGVCVALRVTASKNNQVKGVLEAASFRRLQVAISSPVS